VGTVRYSRAESAFLIGVPLAWAVLLLFHPTGEGTEYYGIVRDEVTPWLVVHLGTMLLLPLLAVAVYVLLRGIDGTAALVSRIALVVFAVFYTAFEVLVGIGSGILADQINALPAAERAVGSELMQGYNDTGIITVFEILGGLGWLVAVGAAGVALYQRAHTFSSVAVVFLFVLSAPGIIIHVTPFGPVGLVLFIVALLLVMRGARPARELSPPVGQPGPA
jgi:hypothetical protein